MDKKNKQMVFTVTKTNIILAFLVILIFMFIKVSYATAFLVGTITALINFWINSYVVDRSFKGKRAKVIIPISFIIRMLLILGVTLLFKANYENLIMYLVGFVFHQVAIFIYARRKPKYI
ncbi:MAG: ATP synthase subunit I [Sarcina sp.]